MRSALVAVVASWAAAASAQQVVYRCADATGKVAYQAEPCASASRQTQVKLPANPPPSAPRESMWKGYTPPKVVAVTFYYDPAEQPVGFSTEQVEAAMRSAMEAWMAGCNVRLQYGGRAERSTAAGAERVIVRWAPEYMTMSHPADSRSGIAGTGSLSDGIALRPRFDERNILGTLVHEMGHVLGLPHKHADTQSIMSYLRDAEVRRESKPNAGDFLDCNLSMKRQFGIDFSPPAGAGASNLPRMSDAEALKRLNAPKP